MSRAIFIAATNYRPRSIGPAEDFGGIAGSLAADVAAVTPASVREANARLEQAGRGIDDIAADLGSLMADVAFGPLERLERDWRAHCDKYQLGGKS